MEKISIKSQRTRQIKGLDRDSIDWMKYHTIQDLRDIVFELYNRGEDISEMVELIHQMDDMAHRTHITCEDSVYTNSEYDILSYVEEVERAYS